MQLFIEKYKFIVIGIPILILGILIYHHQGDDEGDSDLLSIELEEPVDEETNPDLTSEEAIEYVVDVKGQVKRPGVYHVTNQMRVADIIDLAGGFTEDAKEEAINLAAKITDEMVIFVPGKDDELEHLPLNSVQAMVGASESDGKVHLNRASLDEITSLNGIGPKKAQAIIDYREEHGPFQTVEDILQVSGIGEKTLENFRDDIVVP